MGCRGGGFRHRGVAYWTDGQDERIVIATGARQLIALNAKTGKVPPVGNTVNVEKATYTNSIGDAMLAAHWRDPDFDTKQPAFYYVRVMQIPTPRWTTYDAAFFGIDRPQNVPATLQDRAYTSPIWYTPKG